MKRVNLIPRELRFGARVKILRFLRAFDVELTLGAWGVFLVLVILVYAIQSWQMGSLSTRVDKEHEQIQVASAKLQGFTTNMEQFEQFKKMVAYQTSILNMRLAYLKTEETRPYKWTEVLKELRRSLPRRVWLSSVSTERDTLRIAGGSFNNTLVSEFMSNLRSSPYFANVTFAYTEKDKISGTKIIKFEILCRYLLKE